MKEATRGMCGIDCASCEAYLATQAGSEEQKELVAAKWRKEYNDPLCDAAFVTCDGCLTPGGRPGGHCLVCELRACGSKRQLASCGLCADYDTCATLADFVAAVPYVKPILDEIRRGV